jgi:hypothetical protein
MGRDVCWKTKYVHMYRAEEKSLSAEIIPTHISVLRRVRSRLSPEEYRPRSQPAQESTDSYCVCFVPALAARSHLLCR